MEILLQTYAVSLEKTPVMKVKTFRRKAACFLYERSRRATHTFAWGYTYIRVNHLLPPMY